VAWFKLGEYPTPVIGYRIQIPGIENPLTINIKRESLASEYYGGNKVRTLEFQLGCCASIIERNRNKNETVYAIGAAGSNQCVATSVYGIIHGIPVENVLLLPDEPHIDNSLNLISLFGLPVNVHALWSKIRKLLGFCLYIIFSKQLLLPPGGANPTGVLGQIEGALELAKQIEKGEVVEPEDIFLPIGSSCTISGLIIGIALARKLNIGFKKPLEKFHIHGVIIHHAFAKVPGVVRYIIKRLIRDTSKVLLAAGGPDIYSDALMVCRQCIIMTEYAGKYGQMTEQAQNAKNIFDSGEWVHQENLSSYPSSHRANIPAWLDACFLAKAGAALIDFLKIHPEKSNTTLLWETKSLVQPRSLSVETTWSNLQKEENEDRKVREFVIQSGINSRKKVEERTTVIDI
jgi:hypothetical protein